MNIQPVCNGSSYYTDISESVQFHENGPESPIYVINTYQQIKNPFAISRSDSREIDITDKSSEDLHNEINQFYKCFKCYGASCKSTSMESDAKCTQCEGKQFISSQHPLAILMQELMMKKLPFLFNNQPKKKDLLGNLCKSTIKEEESSFQQQSTIICSACNCDEPTINGYYNCKKCSEYNICNTCYQKKGYLHPHSLEPKHCSRRSSFNSNQQTPILIDDTYNFGFKSFSELKELGQQISDVIVCMNCNDSIEGCYESCVDCQQNDKMYIICGDCAFRKNYVHDANHLEMRMKMLSNSNELLLLRNNSKQDQDYAYSHISKESRLNVKTQNSIINIFQDDDEGSKVDIECQNEEDLQVKAITEFGSVDENHCDLLQIELNLKNKLSSTYHNDGEFQKIEQKKTRQKENQSVVNIDNLSCSLDFDLQTETPPTNGLNLLIPMVFSEMDLGASVNNSAKSFINPEKQYLFQDYQCDICLCNPIRNYRYHCKQCEDYDLCQECYTVRKVQHKHTEYDIIDGTEILKKKRESITKQSLGKAGNLMFSARI